jgi:hypothetical protein
VLDPIHNLILQQPPDPFTLTNNLRRSRSRSGAKSKE